MIQIEGICPTCGAELELDVADLLLLLPVGPDAELEGATSAAEAAEAADGARLVHDCSQCGVTCVRAVEQRLARLLEIHGVAVLPDLELEPAVEPHPENPPAGPGLTADEVIDLHDVLQRPDWFDQLVAAGPTA
jgi:hypothetical protein